MWGGVAVVAFCALLLTVTAGAQDIRDLKNKIEAKRRLDIVKNNIMQHIRDNGVQNSVGPQSGLGSDSTVGVSTERSVDLPQVKRDNPIVENNIIQHIKDNGVTYNGGTKSGLMSDSATGVSTERSDQLPQVKRDNPIVILGEPASSVRDGCLNFPAARLGPKRKIMPVKMNLYVYIRLISKNKKRRNSRNTGKAKKKDKGRKRKSNKRRRRKSSKKKRKGRIKITITDGKKRLAKLRRRVTKTLWYAMELPISQFPKEISQTDTFKLCITCKGCKKNVKLDLYRDTSSEKPKIQEIPFINIVTASHLPQSRLRPKRSSDAIEKSKQLLHRKDNSTSTPQSQCCLEEIYTEDIDIPHLLQPSTFSMSFCETLQNTNNSVPSSNRSTSKLLSRESTGTIQRLCVPATYEPFTYSFLDHDLKIKYASIPNLLPTGCKCVSS